LIYSLVVHAALLLAWAIFASHPGSLPRVAEPKFILVEVDPIAKSKPETKAKTQVVQTERAKETKTAAPDAFLGERTQTVSKQTISMPKTGDSAQTSKGATKQKRVAETDAQETGEKAKAPTGAVIQATGALAKFGIAIDASKDYAPKAKARNIVEEASLTAQARGEYVKGFKAGEETMLNTKEFVFYGYFQRLRERLDKAWEKSLRTELQKYFHKGRQLAMEQDYTTQLLVSLDRQGRITKVQVIGASGTRDLDEAAVKAFNEAGPFPNPPSGLVEQGVVRVRWDFVLKT
jgi:protein TonB